jgi:hypothetical protein
MRLLLKMILSAASMGVLGGCGHEPPRAAVHPVSGRATYQGQPMGNAMIGFHPITENGARAYAQTDADGAFHMTTHVSHDGATPGEHVVTIFWPDKSQVRRRTDPADDDDEEPLVPDKLQRHFTNPTTSTLRATVREQENFVDLALP